MKSKHPTTRTRLLEMQRRVVADRERLQALRRALVAATQQLRLRRGAVERDILCPLGGHHLCTAFCRGDDIRFHCRYHVGAMVGWAFEKTLTAQETTA